MAKHFKSEIYEGGVNTDPRSGAGVPAPTGSLLPNNVNAMLWQKFSAAADTRWRRITDMGLNNIVDFGAVGDGVTDNRVAITNAISDAVANGIAGIFIPDGIFAVSKAPASTFSFNLSTILDGFMVMGRGEASKLMMIGDGQGTPWSMFLCDRNEGILFKDLFFDGNRFALANMDPLTSMITFSNGGGPTILCDVDNCQFWRSFGDGVRLAGDAVTPIGTSQISIRNSRFIVNNRFGLSIQRGVGLLLIENNYFNNSGQLDINIESTGANSASDIILNGNQIYAANGGGTLSFQCVGVSNADPNARITFSNNQIDFGNCLVQNTANMVFTGNVITSQPLSAQASIAVRRLASNSIYSQNHVFKPVGPAEQVFSAIGVNGIQPEHLVVQGNTLFQQSPATCVEFDASNFIFSGNKVRFGNVQAAISDGVLIRAITGNITNAKVDGNVISGGEGGGSLDSCIHFDCNPNDINSCTAIGNMGEGAANGVRLETPVGGGFNTFPVISLNQFDVTVTEILGLGVVAAIVVAGNGSTSGASANGCAQFMSTASPVGVFDAPLGSTCMNQAGGAVTTFFVKEGLTAAGWVGK